MIQHLRGVVDQFKQGVTFQRGSMAYDRRGRLYGVNQGRFETFGARRGLRVEEAATNLLTADQSTAEGDISAYAAFGGAVLSKDTNEKWQGSASAQVLTPGTAANEGIALRTGSGYVFPVVNPSATYTASVWVKGSGTVSLRLRDLDAANAVIGDSISATITLTSSWQRVAVTRTMSANAAKADVQVRTNTAQAITFWVDALMLQSGPYATSWTPGGTRSAESLTIPTAGILSPTQGTISMWVYVDSVVKRQVAGQNNRVFQVFNSDGVNDGVALLHAATTADWILRSRDNAGAFTTLTVPDSHTPEGWHHVAAKWSEAELKLQIDGIVRGSAANPKLPTGFGANMFVGSHTSSAWLNALFADLHISNIARADADGLADTNRGYHVPDANTTFWHLLDGPDSQRAARALVI